jgi:hypothetical protein
LAHQIAAQSIAPPSDTEGAMTMHPMHPTLSAMVAAVTLDAKRAAQVPVDTCELERYAQRVLREFQAERLRITDYLPELALKPVLAQVHQHFQL